MEIKSRMQKSVTDFRRADYTKKYIPSLGSLGIRRDNDNTAGIQKQDDPIGSGTVTSNSINVRNGAGMNYERIGGLSKGKSFQVYEEKDGWLKIKYNTQYGWISKQCTDYKSPEPSVTPEEPITSNQVTGKVANIPLENPLTSSQVASAISYNNKAGGIRRFKLDWVGRLYAVFGLKCPADHYFNEAIVQAVASFQKYKSIEVDGKIGPQSRKYLETAYPVLFDELFGSHLEKRTLISAGADTKKRYDYYKSIILAQGGAFDESGRPNILCIRGATRQSDGSVVQDAINKDSHFNSAVTGYDDLMVNMWLNNSVPYVSEYKGSADPQGAGSNSGYGTAHLRDGQYEYYIGSHPLNGNQAVKDMAAKSGSSVKISGDRYTALNPGSNLEILRDSASGNDRKITDSEFKTSVEGIYNRTGAMTDPNGINIHTSKTDGGTSSTGCQNVVPSQYNKFMSELVKTSGNMYYMLIDASKINKTI